MKYLLGLRNQLMLRRKVCLDQGPKGSTRTPWKTPNPKSVAMSDRYALLLQFHPNEEMERARGRTPCKGTIHGGHQEEALAVQRRHLLEGPV